MTIWLRSVLFILGILCAIPWVIYAEGDVSGSQDHPLLTRYPGSGIGEYVKSYDSVEFAVGRDAGGNPKRLAVEGDRTFLRYFYDEKNQPSPLQLLRNYQNAIKKIGGAIAYERLPKDSDGGETTLKVTTGGKDVWVKIEPDIFSAPTQSYKLEIVEVAAMQQAVEANKLLEELNKNGFVALYINFDTGKWDLKPDGQATVKEIITMLKGAPSLNISIEGHTDNVGAAASNKVLSENRAKSVMTAILSGGIDAKRLSAVGYGQEKPIADNRTEDGRGKNRRVELVKR